MPDQTTYLPLPRQALPLRMTRLLAYLLRMLQGPIPQPPRKDPWDVALDSRWIRFRAYLNMIFVDHAFFRYIYLNLHQFSKDAWRSAQPVPHHFGQFARLGIKTIVTARGGMQFGSIALEQEACKTHGLIMKEFVVFSRNLPTREFLLAAPAYFASLQKPVLFHCKSGADRAGFIATLYLIVAEGRPVGEAKKQLSWRFGHFRFAKTGILDAFFDTYEIEGHQRGIPFLDWVRDIYNPDAIRAGFKEHWLHALLSEGILRRE
jgi:protein tyrosine phosphatase (PTP) superfamily phosphohydrolase (DUF442 family)